MFEMTHRLLARDSRGENTTVRVSSEEKWRGIFSLDCATQLLLSV